AGIGSTAAGNYAGRTPDLKAAGAPAEASCMRLLGLVTREFASPEAFLAFVARRALLLSAAGIAAIVLGAALVIAAHAGTGVKIWFAAICIAGAAFAYAGVQARLWAPRALRLSSQSPTP